MNSVSNCHNVAEHTEFYLAIVRQGVPNDTVFITLNDG
jgi:hypothetical protein